MAANSVEDALHTLSQLSLHSDVESSEETSSAVKKWLDYCHRHSDVKCVEVDVPSGILPKGYTGILTDVKVGGKRRRPDDYIYSANPDLRKKVARGNCVLQLNKIEKGKITQTTYIFLVFALKKFSGGLGDEDDSALGEWENYFIQPIENTRKVVSTEKANGEAAHISCRQLMNVTYYCIGSKNVHMLLRNKEDILKYTDGRFQFAQRVADTFFARYMDNSEISEEAKQSFLTILKENKFTAVAEILQPDHQHIVNLSYLSHPLIQFICWTKPDLEEDFHSTDLCALPVDEGIDRARKCGFSTVDCQVLAESESVMDKVDVYMTELRRDVSASEGKVLYFMDKHGNTIGLIKKKSALYILLRALREKVSHFGTSRESMSLSERYKKVEKRIREIQKWLGFSDEYAQLWINVSKGFVEWVSKSKYATNVRSRFPIAFDEFLNDSRSEKYRLDYESLKTVF